MLVIGAAITLREALTAADTLEAEGTNVRVMDPFTIKPIDKEAIISNAQECGGRIIVVEDHYPEGQLAVRARTGEGGVVREGKVSHRGFSGSCG